MNAHQLNKYIGAVLAALVFAMGLSVLSEIIFEPHELYDPAYVVAIADDDAALRGEEAAETPFAVLLAEADPAAGKNGVRVCGACHTFNEGGANGIGPALHGVVGRAIAAVDGFNYSAALKTYGEGKVWDYEELSGFIENPQAHVRGTIMSFAGVKDPAKRAEAIVYLASESPDAPPLPEPPAEVAEVVEGEAPADAAGAEAGAGEDAAAPAAEGTAPAADDAAAPAEPAAPAGEEIVPAAQVNAPVQESGAEAVATEAPVETETPAEAADEAKAADGDTVAPEGEGSAVDAQNVTIEPARKSQVEVVNPQPSAD
ncbi:MAG: hypothetical protein AcusKO_19090 [Acuticoccus sp.]